ncbi:hypothetical protein T439DRAFT_323748, partial [Meredithblackwellia eburnea MCA 4105]
MTSRFTRSRKPALRSSIDIWSVRSDPTHPQNQPQISFPTTSSSASPSPAGSPAAQGSPAAFSSAYSSPKSTTYDSPTFTSPDGSLTWRDSDGPAKSPSQRRKDMQREVLVRQATVGTLILTIIILGTIYSFSLSDISESPAAVRRKSSPPPNVSVLGSALGRKPPPSFRDNLVATSKYVTSPQHGGFAHQVMSMYHLTYIAGALDRTPLIPPFYIPARGHRPQELIPASQVYDFDRFRNSVNVQPVDWAEVQPKPDPAKPEQLGCWVGPKTDRDDLIERTSWMRMLGLDPSFFPLRVPASAKKDPADRVNDFGSAVEFLSAFDADVSAKDGLIDQALHTSSVTTISENAHKDPEQQVFCVDHTLYHTVGVEAHLDQHEHTAFLSHGRQLYFNQELDEAGSDVIAFVLGHRLPFIAVHVSARAACVKKDGPDGPCSYSLANYIASVERVRLLAASNGRKSREQRHTVRALSVLVSTDVTDIGFLGEIVNQGWSLLDHNDVEIRQRYGSWAPAVIESVVHSRANAFVGTKDCSESTLAALRVRAWRQAPVEL